MILFPITNNFVPLWNCSRPKYSLGPTMNMDVEFTKINKMRNIHFCLTILLSVVLLSTGCASKKQGKWLDAHYQLLERAANSNISPERKMDILAESYTKMMHQSLNFVNPKKAVAYAKTYSQQNEQNIDKILKELGGWQKDMTLADKVSMGLKMTKKPYTKDMVDLFPRFRRKFKTYGVIMALSGKVRKSIFNFGGKKLGDMFGGN